MKSLFKVASDIWQLSQSLSVSSPNHSTSKGGNGISQPISHSPCIGLVRGQRRAKEALLIAAAGRHNILMVGPPGEGKSYLASTIPGYLPRPSRMDLESLSGIYSYSGTPLSQDTSGGILRPYRGIGPTITLSTLIGGGRSEPIPGEISLSHTGVLFMDELPQYDRSLIDSLRTPLESKQVSITRNGFSHTFPCDFMLVAAMNPCPCGYLSRNLPGPISPGQAICSCTDSQIQRYQARISGPILDRIDLVVEMESLSSQERFSPAIENQSEVFKSKIIKAWNIALRFRGMLNCDLGPKEVFDRSRHNVEYLSLDSRMPCQTEYPPVFGPLAWTESGLSYFQSLQDKEGYSTRRVIRLARLSRTIADLSNCYGIVPQHITCAASYLQSDLLP